MFACVCLGCSTNSWGVQCGCVETALWCLLLHHRDHHWSQHCLWYHRWHLLWAQGWKGMYSSIGHWCLACVCTLVCASVFMCSYTCRHVFMCLCCIFQCWCVWVCAHNNQYRCLSPCTVSHWARQEEYMLHLQFGQPWVWAPRQWFR